MKVKVGWILLGDENSPSSRMIGINMHNWMISNGIDSTILYKPEGYNLPIPEVPSIEEALNSNFTHMIFQKNCFGRAEYYLRKAKSKGIKTIYIIDDFMVDALQVLVYADIVLTGSKVLRQWILDTIRKEAVIIQDFYEFDREFYKRDYTPNDPPIAVSYSGRLHVEKALEIKPLLDELGYRFEIIANHPQATIPWHREYWKDLIKADLMVIPHLGVLSTWEQAKSNNRPVVAAVLGLPVIASPYPEYIQTIEQWKTGIICFDNDLRDWREGLEYLKSPDVREQIGRAARDSTLKDRFSVDAVGHWWISLLGGAL